MMASEHVLEIDSLSQSFGSRMALDKVCLHVDSGEVVGLLGQYGAGKTTLLRTASGLLPTTEGEIRFKGEPVSAFAAHDRLSWGIGFITEMDSLLRGLTVEQGLLSVLENVTESSPDMHRRVQDLMSTYRLLNHADYRIETLPRGRFLLFEI